MYNAKVLEKINAAKIILNDDLTAEKLDLEIKNIVLYPQVMQIITPSLFIARL